MTDKLLLSALTLLINGTIEIPTKNETNTLKHTKYTPQTRLEILTTEEDAYNEKCLNECTVVATIPEEINNFSCLHYALQKILDVTLEEEINFPGRLFSIFVEDYFEQTDNPQPNDLVIYTYDKNEPQITHFAVVIDNNTIESKWGYSPEIRCHSLLNVPTSFGNAAWFYTLKKKYKDPKGKAKAIAKIHECLDLQKKILTELQQEKPTAFKRRLGKLLNI
jgi:hypothetical protein